MAILANRVKTKNYLRELIKFVFSSLKRLAILTLILLCSYLIYFPIPSITRLSLEISGFTLSFSSVIYDTVIENFKILQDKLHYFRDLQQENLKLRQQLDNLSMVESVATKILAENIELRKLLNVTEGPKHNYITSRLIGISITPFSSSGIIEAGSNNNIKLDDLVINQNILIGRVTSVSANYSSIMLLNDISSRVPIVTSFSKEKGILAKQGEGMKIIYLPEEHKVNVGELVYTSGDGKIYPHGILIGEVYKIDNEGIFVRLSANLNNIEYVTIELKAEEK